jgi:hypothetical protein
MKVLFLALEGLSTEEARSWLCHEYGTGKPVKINVRFRSYGHDDILGISLRWQPDLIVDGCGKLHQSAQLMDVLSRFEKTKSIPIRLTSRLEINGDVIMMAQKRMKEAGVSPDQDFKLEVNGVEFDAETFKNCTH